MASTSGRVRDVVCYDSDDELILTDEQVCSSTRKKQSLASATEVYHTARSLLAAPFAHAPHPSGPYDVYHPNTLKCRILPLPSHRCIIAGAYHTRGKPSRTAPLLRTEHARGLSERLHSAIQGMRSRRVRHSIAATASAAVAMVTSPLFLFSSLVRSVVALPCAPVPTLDQEPTPSPRTIADDHLPLQNLWLMPEAPSLPLAWPQLGCDACVCVLVPRLHAGDPTW